MRRLKTPADLFLHGVAYAAVDAEQIQCHDSQSGALRVFQHQGFGVQVVDLSFGRLRAGGIPGHPHRLVRRDGRGGDPGLPALLVAWCGLNDGDRRRPQNHSKESQEEVPVRSS